MRNKQEMADISKNISGVVESNKKLRNLDIVYFLKIECKNNKYICDNKNKIYNIFCTCISLLYKLCKFKDTRNYKKNCFTFKSS